MIIINRDLRKDILVEVKILNVKNEQQDLNRNYQ